jgi:hypothetical protein
MLVGWNWNENTKFYVAYNYFKHDKWHEDFMGFEGQLGQRAVARDESIEDPKGSL